MCACCDTLQHSATHCNTLQRTATHYNTLQHSATHCNTPQHTTTHCNTLQRTATHHNTLQHTATCAHATTNLRVLCRDMRVCVTVCVCVCVCDREFNAKGRAREIENTHTMKPPTGERPYVWFAKKLQHRKGVTSPLHTTMQHCDKLQDSVRHHTTCIC